MRKAYLFLIALLLWAAWFWYHYVFHIKQLGTPPESPAAEQVSESTLAAPTNHQFLFKPSDSNLFLFGNNTIVLDSILAQGKTGQTLQITGYFTPMEQLGLDFDLGLARASELKKLLANRLSENYIALFSDTIRNFIYYQDSLFEGITYEWVDAAVVETPKNYYLIDHDTKRIKTETFETILTEIADRIKKSGEQVVIRGHTDSNGDKELNFIIALRNAKDVRDIFKAKGVARKQITTTSRGEEDPITTNENQEGRKTNRRIEIEIIDD